MEMSYFKEQYTQLRMVMKAGVIYNEGSECDGKLRFLLLG